MHVWFESIGTDEMCEIETAIKGMVRFFVA